MYKMILQDGKEFSVESLIDVNGVLEIEFSQGTAYLDVASVYDPISEEFNEDALRRFELINGKEEIEGIHIGYTEVKNISAFNGVVKVQVAKELELKTDVVQLKKDSEELKVMKENFVSLESELMITNQYVTDLELELFEIKMQL